MKRISLITLLITLGFFAFSQELIDIYQSNFDKANLETKLQVLQDGINKKIEGLGPLFNRALYYIINNYSNVSNRSATKDISMLCIDQINSLNYKPAKTTLWQLFLVETTTQIRINILNTLPTIASDDPDIIKKINDWLSKQNEIFKTTKNQDLQVIAACIQAIGKIGDASSFTPLLMAIITGYNDAILKITEQAIHSLKGDLKENYISVVTNGRFIEKKFALVKSFTEDKLTDTEKCQVAIAAAGIALNLTIENPEEKDMARDMRDKALAFLADKEWSDATPEGVAHFKRSFDEYDHKIINSLYFIRAIRFLGHLKKHESAVALKDYLDSTNFYTEGGKPYDEAVVLETISSLKNIGDKIARSSLLYVGYLRYSASIKKAADDAFNTLK